MSSTTTRSKKRKRRVTFAEPDAPADDVPQQAEETKQEAEQPAEVAEVAATLCVGSYSGALFGLECPSMASSFGSDAHDGVVRCLAHSADGRYVASGGSDDLIRVFDLVKRVEYGCLYQHQGIVSSLRFYGNSHLLSASADGSVCVWRCSDWTCMRVMKGHAGAVADVDVHPSGRVAISVGAKDSTLRVWDLTKGTLAATRRYEAAEAPVVARWSPDGKRYAVVLKNGVVRIIHASKNKRLHELKEASGKRVLSLQYVTDSLLVAGTEQGDIHVWNAAKGEDLGALPGHKSRVRCISSLHKPSTETAWMASASSDGQVFVWDLSGIAYGSSSQASIIGSRKSGARLTALTLAHADEQFLKADAERKERQREARQENKRRKLLRAKEKKQEQLAQKRKEEESDEADSVKKIKQNAKRQSKLQKKKKPLPQQRKQQQQQQKTKNKKPRKKKQ